jgi:hypothetical protein
VVCAESQHATISSGFRVFRFLIPIEGSSMIEIDMFFLYGLALEVHRLRDLPAMDLDGSWAFVAAMNARGFLQTMLQANSIGSVLPRSSENAQGIVNFINGLYPDAKIRLLSEEERAGIGELVRVFEDDLQKDTKHAYVVAVQDQRILSAHVMIEHIATAFSPEVWNHLPIRAKNNAQESGRCLALERFTASGFHIMRAVEAIVVYYIFKCTGNPPDPGNRNFGAYIRTLEANKAEQKAIRSLRELKDLDRNPLIHPESDLDQDEAISLFILCSQTVIPQLIADMNKRGYFGPVTASTT